MSVPLQSVPEDQDSDNESSEDSTATQAKHEAAEIVARARRQAEAIVAEARTEKPEASSPLAALGDNAEEIIGQVRKLIKKQRQLQTERQALVEERDAMAGQIDALAAERDELVQRLTDAVVRMEELAALADQSQPPVPAPQPRPMTPPPAASISNEADSPSPREMDLDRRVEAAPPTPVVERPSEEDTSLAARLKQAEADERAAAGTDSSPQPQAMLDDEDGMPSAAVGADGRSFYSRNSAKLPRLEGDGGRSVLSAVGGMRPESEPKGRKGRRRKKDK